MVIDKEAEALAAEFDRLLDMSKLRLRWLKKRNGSLVLQFRSDTRKKWECVPIVKEP